MDQLRAAWKKEAEAARKFLPDARPESLLFFQPQGYSGLEVGLLPIYCLWLCVTWAFPHIFGIVAPTWKGFFLLLPEPAVDVYEGYTWNLTDALHYNVIDIYSDNAVPKRGPRGQFPNELVAFQARRAYLHWAIHAIDKLMIDALAIRDLITRLVVQWTIARITVETYLVAISDVPLVRKTLMYHILDKYASLTVLARHPIAAPEGDSGDPEVRAWIRLLEKTTWLKYVRPILASVPDPAGKALVATTEWGYEKLASGEPAPALLRAYRNTSHGYNIRKFHEILHDTGEIDNDLPDVLLGLWHYLLRGDIVARLRTKKVEG